MKFENLFTSVREKWLWFWAFIVVLTILSSLFMGQPLARQLRDQNVQAIFFLTGILLVVLTTLVYGIRNKPGTIEITIFLGLMAVFIMFYFRLGAPERSHLIEYGVLALFIYNALKERARMGNQKRRHPILALTITFLVGVLDECIQLFIPDRVFDPQDIFFNGMVAFMTIGSAMILSWIRRRMTTSK